MDRTDRSYKAYATYFQKTMKILFLNYELGFEGGGRQLMGWSGQVYGWPSRWHPGFAAQACEIEVKDVRDYLMLLRDIAAAWHLPLRRWLPLPEFATPGLAAASLPENPPAPGTSPAVVLPKAKSATSRPATSGNARPKPIPASHA